MSRETVSEKIDHKIRTGLAIMLFVGALYATLADLYCRYFDDGFRVYYTIFGFSVGMLTGALIKARYLLPGFMGSGIALLLACNWYLNDNANVWPLTTVMFMAFGANLPLFWKLHKIQAMRQVVANSKTATRLREK